MFDVLNHVAQNGNVEFAVHIGHTITIEQSTLD